MIYGGVSAIYRRAILLALESLHDHQSRSNVDAIKRHTKSLLDDDDYPWNEILFMKTFKSIADSGEIQFSANIMAELSPEYKRRRSDSILQKIEQEQNAMQQVANIYTPVLYSNSSHPSSLAENSNQQQQQLQQNLMPSTMGQEQNDARQMAATSSTSTTHHSTTLHQHPQHSKQQIPHRRSEHEKWKIIPKKVYDKTM
jgi:hypothetical protein